MSAFCDSGGYYKPNIAPCNIASFQQIWQEDYTLIFGNE
jgi:hypothetical protein